MGPVAALKNRHAGASWERFDAILLPGLVNAHVNLEFSALRGRVAGGDGAVAWLRRILDAERRQRPEQDLEAIEASVSRLLHSGHAAIGNVCASLASVDALKSSPLLVRMYGEVRGDLAVAKPLPECEPGTVLAPNISLTRVPHSFVALPARQVGEIVRRAGSATQRSTMRIAWNTAERAWLTRREGPFAELGQELGWSAAQGHEGVGLGSVELADQLGILGPLLLCSHLVDARPSELRALAAARCSTVICPRAALHIELKLPPLTAMLDAGLEPALGTDSLASAPTLNVLDEARALRTRFPGVSPRVLLAMATCWGGRALGLSHQIGLLAEGLRPGVLAVCHEPGALPDDPAEFVLRARDAETLVLAAPASAHVRAPIDSLLPFGR